MADEPNIKVEGQKALLRNLRKIDPELGKALKDLNADAAQEVAKTARTLVPRRTGTLAESIRSSGTNRFGVVRAGKASVPYGAPIHWGWAKRHIKPQPFLYEALDARADEVVERYAMQLDELLDRIMDGSRD